jgi:hypothetical protein
MQNLLLVAGSGPLLSERGWGEAKQAGKDFT